MDEVRSVAAYLGYDILNIPGKYFVVCDWYLDIVAMFDDKDYGYEKAINWMKENKAE